MRYKKCLKLFLLLWVPFNLNCQCAFKYISNDTLFQDYIGFIYTPKNVDEIITTGSRINRGVINDSIFNAPIFQRFDYCGKLLDKIIFSFIENYKLKHIRIPRHSSYLDEPIGNNTINLYTGNLLLVDKAIDTILKQQVLILYQIDKMGAIRNFSTLNLDNHEANQTTLKSVLQLKDGKILVILWDYLNEYGFYYFDENANYLFKKVIGSAAGIRTIKEFDNYQFICTSNKSVFEYYKLDTVGNILWLKTPYGNQSGSARDVIIDNNEIYIIGSSTTFGVFLKCDSFGNIKDEFKYDSFYCQPRFCSIYKTLDDGFIITGYFNHCEQSNTNGTDIAILKVDKKGNILVSQFYNFRNSLGTSGPNGYYPDYGGYLISMANDEGIVTNGVSKYNRLTQGGLLHEDALLIKTQPLITTNDKVQIKQNYKLHGTLVRSELTLIGDMHKIKDWIISSSNGMDVIKGTNWENKININSLNAGLYILILIDKDNYWYYLKFIKI